MSQWISRLIALVLFKATSRDGRPQAVTSEKALCKRIGSNFLSLASWFPAYLPGI